VTDSARSQPASTTPPRSATEHAPVAVPKPRRGRNKLRDLELVLVLVACAINAAAILLVQLGAGAALGGMQLVLGLVLAALMVGVHITLRFVAPGADPFMLPVTALLGGLGIAQIYRIDLAVGLTGWDSTANRQMTWTGISLAACILVLVFLRNHRVLFRYTYLAGAGAVVLLLLPLVPGLGKAENGAQVWIGLGPLSFQPGELAKILLAVFFAGYLVRNRDSLATVGRSFLGLRFPRLRALGPILVFWLLAMGVLVFQRDLGTSLLYFALFLVMIYLATGRPGWVFIGLALFVAGALLAGRFLPYVQARFDNWLNAFSDSAYNATGGSYQLVQGIFGLANGGLIGTGWGQGYPDVTPLSQSDYIVASLGEELGLAGLFVIFGLYLVLVARGLRVGFAGQDDFGALLAGGLSFALALQVFIVVGGIMRIIPLTGLTAPFLAAGGSSLLSNWLIVALLLRLSDSIRNRPRLVIES